MNTIATIPIESIHRRPDARALNDDAVAALEDSIATVGLINPIRVRPIGDGYEVVAGAHRFAACDLLGHREIACIVVEEDDLHAELAMIDENLWRAELSQAVRAQLTKRRKAIYEELHPQTRNGTNQHSSLRQVGEPSSRFTADTAAKSGKSERAVQRDAERGGKITDEALDLVSGTKLDTGVFLDKLKKLPADEQADAARQALAESEKVAAPALGASRDARQPNLPFVKTEDSYARFLELADRLETLPVISLITDSGPNRAVLGLRASRLADHMSDIMEGLSQ